PKRYGNDSFISADPETLDFLQSKSADQVFDYINKNTTLSIWANGDGIPVKFLLSIRMIPNVTTGPAAQKQINLDVAVTLNDINKKQKIDVPQDSISAEEVYMMFTGKTKEEVQAERQEQAVSKIRGALGTYSSLSGGTYPATLEDLKKKGSEIIPLNTNNNENYYGEYYKNKKILEVVPNDVVTKQPFMYSASGKTYKLTYTIDLAPYKKGTQMYGLYQTDYTSGNTYKIYLKYINGINTATEKALSEEALAAAKLDSDGDKVTNALEDYLGTNKNKADTDGDRTSDYDEITRGSDPLGPGYLESSYRGDFF
ncbi:MAG: hypothetical protein K0S38_956, partial [Candidatus Paceibacter sp.]|nr:hypothetical protein [Candidatus Paceibacter sp.]